MKAVKSFWILILVLSISSVLILNVSGQENGKTNEVKTVVKVEENSTPADKNIPDGRQILANDNKDERYRIGYQDTIEVQVNRQPQLSGQFSINPSGKIYLPKLDEPIVAVCKTEFELGDEIAAQYRKNYLRNPFVTVRIVEQRSQSFAVIGAVEKPGSYFINRKVRLLELLALAGGHNDKAGTRLIVARAGSNSNCKAQGEKLQDEEEEIEVLNFNLNDVLEAKVNLWMKPGDVVSVRDAEVIYVVGNVVEPQVVRLKERITLTQAIAHAQGLKPAAQKDKVRILRQKAGSADREELVFNLKDIDERKVQDPVLQPNDVVAVSTDKVKSILNSVGKALTQGIPNTFYMIP
ncbi:MAG TPA: SLBB domain-containing protein [Pyrinomonadaceae bacterium]|nr:SLBB domain-containing protein [Pyrinomonadaceae bacterium]